MTTDTTKKLTKDQELQMLRITAPSAYLATYLDELKTHGYTDEQLIETLSLVIADHAIKTKREELGFDAIESLCRFLRAGLG